MDDNGDDGTLTWVHQAALRQFVSAAPQERGRGRAARSADPPREGCILLDIRGREIGINGNDHGELDFVVDDEFRTRLVHDLMSYLFPVSADSRDEIWMEYKGDCLPFSWTVALRQRNVTPSDFAVLLDVARASNRSCVRLNLHDVEDECAAQRVVTLLAAFADLQELVVRCLSNDRREGEIRCDYSGLKQRLQWLLKALSGHKKSSPTFATKLSNFSFLCDCGVSPTLFIEFFESMASSLEEVSIGPAFEFGGGDFNCPFQLVLGQLPRLKVLDFSPVVWPHTAKIVKNLVHAPKLQDLYLQLSLAEYYIEYDPECFDPDELEDLAQAIANVHSSVAGLAASSRTLRYLSLTCVEDRPLREGRDDVSAIILRAADSSSLETLEFKFGSVGGSEATGRRGAPPNETVSVVGFEHCELREGAFELLSRFKGINSIRLVGCSGLERAGQWQSFLANLPRLKTLFTNMALHDAALDGIARAAHSFDKLTIFLNGASGDEDLGYPSLRTLLVETGGGVELNLYNNESNRYLVAGIEGAKKLESLSLRLYNSSPEALALVFKAVQLNKSLRSFACDVYVDSEQRGHVANECTKRLLDLMRLNPRLKVFTFNDEGLSRALLPTIVEGLRVNRSIEVLDLGSSCRSWGRTHTSDSTVIKNLTDVLKDHNTSLKTIKGLERETKDVRDPIEEFLRQNRSGRHFLRNAELVTPCLFPCILAAIGNDTGADGIRYFLKNLSKERLLRILSSRGMTRSRPSEEE